MTNRLRKSLKIKVKATVLKAIAQGLGNGSSSELKNSIDEIEMYSKILLYTEPNFAHDSAIALAVAILILLIAGGLWSTKVGHTNVSLVADTDSLHMTLSQQWNLNDSIAGRQIHLDRLSTLQDPALGLSLDDSDGDVWLRVEGGQIAIQSLQVAGGGSMDLAGTTDRLELFVSNATLIGRISISGKMTLTAGTADRITLNKTYDLLVPETIEFGVSGPKAAGAQMEVHLPQKWSLGLVPCADLRFSREVRFLAERQILSGVRGGTLQFNDTSWPVIQLTENQMLSVSGTDTSRVQIHGGQNAMHVTLDGMVENVTLGDSERRRQIAPSYLEYLYNKKSLVLFCTAIAGGWGLLWGIRKTIFR